MHGSFFSVKYSSFWQQIATASLQKAFTNIVNQKDIPMLLAVGICALALYITDTLIGRNITNHSLEKKKRPASIYLAAKQLSIPYFQFENG